MSSFGACACCSTDFASLGHGSFLEFVAQAESIQTDVQLAFGSGKLANASIARFRCSPCLRSMFEVLNFPQLNLRLSVFSLCSRW